MIRSKEATGKTVEEARAAACAALGVNADDLNVSYEVLEMPQSTGFLGLKKIPCPGSGHGGGGRPRPGGKAGGEGFRQGGEAGAGPARRIRRTCRGRAACCTAGPARTQASQEGRGPQRGAAQGGVQSCPCRSGDGCGCTGGRDPRCPLTLNPTPR